jgi:hypothetical protein
VDIAAQPIASDHRLPPQRPAPTILYVDRSGSMNGYLDAGDVDSALSVHRSASNLRTTLSRLLAVGGTGTRVYGFGNSLSALPPMEEAEALRQLVSQSFYSDSDTRTELALANVRADSARASVHIVVTDGRRGSGAAAIGQYQRLGEVAAWWTAGEDSGGVFAVAASMAPFRQVRGDRAGCWQGTPGGESATAGRCPLYLFVFAPASSAERVLGALGALGGRMYVYPAYADERIRVEYAPVQLPATAELGMARTTPLVLSFRSRAPQNQLVSGKVDVTLHAGESTARFALDDELAWSLEQAPLTGRPPQWSPVRDPAQAWVQPGALRADSAGAALTLPLELRTQAGLGAILYRVQLSTRGTPRWLGQFEAVQQGDSVRTYGLSTLLDHLRPAGARLAGFYVTTY